MPWAMTARVVVDLADSGPDGPRGERDRIRRIEDVEGGDGSDLIVGDHRGNVISPGKGRDRVEGRGGADVLDGDDGDRLLGGRGDDFLYPLSARLDCGPGQDATPVPTSPRKRPCCGSTARASGFAMLEADPGTSGSLEHCAALELHST